MRGAAIVRAGRWHAEHTSPRRRRGSLYAAVLVVALVVSMLVLSGLHAATLYLNATQAGVDREQARLLAVSAIEYALAELNTNTTWQENYTTGTEYPSPPIATAGGTLTWRLVDREEGGLRLDGIGRVGEAKCILSVDLQKPLILDAALLVGGNLTMNASEQLTLTDGPAIANGTLLNNGTISGDIEAATLHGGGTVSGARRTLQQPRSLPDASFLFDYYLQNGTVITPSYRSSENARVIEDTLLSPNWNPYGPTGSSGIYIIDTKGESLVIRDCRIVGTLVVPDLPPGRKVLVAGNVNWEPAYPNFPALLVDGDLRFEHTDTGLRESLLGLTNFNPPGTPWQGKTDALPDDTYPSVIAGIIYCSGTLEFDGNHGNYTSLLEGLVIAAGNCFLYDAAKPVIRYDTSFAALPPPGFGDAQLQMPQEVAAVTDLTSVQTDSVRGNRWWGVSFLPKLPANAIMWRLTKLEVRGRQHSGGGGTLRVVTHTAGEDRAPRDIIEKVNLPHDLLPVDFDWIDVPVDGPGRWIPATEGMCITLEASGAKAAEVQYQTVGLTDGSVALLRGDGTSWSNPEPHVSIGFRVEAEYTTTSGNPVSIRIGSWRQTTGP